MATHEVKKKKELLKTGTFLSAIVSIFTGAGLCYAGNVAEGMALINAGVMAIFLRRAIHKIPEATEVSGSPE